MNYPGILIGSLAILLGFGIIVVSTTILRSNRIINSLTGIAFLLIGLALFWLGFQENVTVYVSTDTTSKQYSFLLAILVISLFLLKGGLDMWEGVKQLQNKEISPALAFKSKLQIIFAVIVSFFMTLILLVVFAQFPL